MAAIVRQLRYRRGWTQQDLATRSGMSIAVVRRAEGSPSRWPLRQTTYRRLYEALSPMPAADARDFVAMAGLDPSLAMEYAAAPRPAADLTDLADDLAAIRALLAGLNARLDAMERASAPTLRPEPAPATRAGPVALRHPPRQAAPGMIEERITPLGPDGMPLPATGPSRSTRDTFPAARPAQAGKGQRPQPTADRAKRRKPG